MFVARLLIERYVHRSVSFTEQDGERVGGSGNGSGGGSRGDDDHSDDENDRNRAFRRASDGRRRHHRPSQQPSKHPSLQQQQQQSWQSQSTRIGLRFGPRRQVRRTASAPATTSFGGQTDIGGGGGGGGQCPPPMVPPKRGRSRFHIRDWNVGAVDRKTNGGEETQQPRVTLLNRSRNRRRHLQAVECTADAAAAHVDASNGEGRTGQFHHQHHLDGDEKEDGADDAEWDGVSTLSLFSSYTIRTSATATATSKAGGGYLGCDDDRTVRSSSSLPPSFFTSTSTLARSIPSRGRRRGGRRPGGSMVMSTTFTAQPQPQPQPRRTASVPAEAGPGRGRWQSADAIDDTGSARVGGGRRPVSEPHPRRHIRRATSCSQITPPSDGGGGNCGAPKSRTNTKADMVDFLLADRKAATRSISMDGGITSCSSNSNIIAQQEDGHDLDWTHHESGKEAFTADADADADAASDVDKPIPITPPPKGSSSQKEGPIGQEAATKKKMKKKKKTTTKPRKSTRTKNRTSKSDIELPESPSENSSSTSSPLVDQVENGAKTQDDVSNLDDENNKNGDYDDKDWSSKVSQHKGRRQHPGDSGSIFRRFSSSLPLSLSLPPILPPTHISEDDDDDNDDEDPASSTGQNNTSVQSSPTSTLRSSSVEDSIATETTTDPTDDDSPLRNSPDHREECSPKVGYLEAGDDEDLDTTGTCCSTGSTDVEDSDSDVDSFACDSLACDSHASPSATPPTPPGKDRRSVGIGRRSSIRHQRCLEDPGDKPLASPRLVRFADEAGMPMERILHYFPRPPLFHGTGKDDEEKKLMEDDDDDEDGCERRGTSTTVVPTTSVQALQKDHRELVILCLANRPAISGTVSSQSSSISSCSTTAGTNNIAYEFLHVAHFPTDHVTVKDLLEVLPAVATMPPFNGATFVALHCARGGEAREYTACTPFERDVEGLDEQWLNDCQFRQNELLVAAMEGGPTGMDLLTAAGRLMQDATVRTALRHAVKTGAGLVAVTGASRGGAGVAGGVARVTSW